MATPLTNVYDAFMARITTDDWMTEADPDDLKADWREFLNMAIFRFKFPRIPLYIDGDSFIADLGNAEIQVLATYMKHEWVRRCVATWENLREMYSDRDFSQANFIDKLRQIAAQVDAECVTAMGIYDRSRNYKAVGFKAILGEDAE